MPLDIEATPTVEAAGDRAGGWWSQPFSVFQTNLQEIDAVMDVEKTLDFIEGYGADTWLINTGGIVSFYPTDLSFQTRNPLLANRPSGDLIGDAVAAAHRRGIRVLSRQDFSKVSTRIAQEHPEWLFVSPTGAPQVYNTLFSTCPSADYYQYRSLDILDEVIDRYPVDGFFFNWFGFSERDYSRVYHGVCHCKKCQEGFDAFSGGKKLPEGPQSATYPEWLQFSSQVIKTLTSKIANHISMRRPDAGLVLGRGAPIVYHEANNAFGRELWHHNTAEWVSAHVTAMPEIALMVNSVSFVDMPYRMAGEQPEHFAQYLLQAIARGGNPSTYIMGTPGRIPYANLAYSSSITKFHRKHRDLYAQLKPASSIALVRPDRLRSASPGYTESVEEFRGLYKALQEKHFPFDVIAAEFIGKMAEEGALERYSLIVLPDLGPLERPAAEALDDFISRGGNVVLTGSSGVTESGGIELASSPALMRVGAPKSGDELWSTYVTDSEQPEIGAYRYVPSVIPTYGSYARFVWKPGVEKIGKLLPQAPFGPPEKCYGHTASDDPAFVKHVSKGTIVQFPWTIGRTYREFGTTQVRDHFLEAIKPLTGQKVFAELPEQVELFLGRDEKGFVVHLVNQSGARRKSFGPHLAIKGGRLRLRGAGMTRNPELLVSGETAAARESNGDLVIDLPPIELFEVVRMNAGR
ncbi:alpha-amylase family protein [Microvirga yunnanensis]|uniref:alpha-amylase family protein n=1 Tax=Microvirga yunnanensis TaxID=2953740 RepID=UPI0021C6B12B|nr:alpha-amylase family protein [Microvirga sp. HBU65207]